MILVACSVMLTCSAASSAEHCNKTEDCVHINEYFRCLPATDYNTGKEIHTCQHKGVWPLEPKEWLGTFCFAVFKLFSVVAGIGGGGVAIPMAMGFFNLEFKQAVGVSSFSITFANLLKFIFDFKAKHPEKPQCTVIDYDIASVMMPLTLVGSLLGTFVF